MSLSVPFTFAAATTGLMVRLDENYDAITDWINARNATVGPLASRPPAGNAGAVWMASDQSNRLYVDDGVAWRGSGPVEVVNKAADQVLNNSAVLQNDTHLRVTLGVFETIFFRLALRLQSLTTADFKLAFTMPAAGIARWWPSGTGRWNAGGTWTHTGEQIEGVALDFSGLNSGVQVLDINGVAFSGATPGNLQLQWAQNTAVALDTTVFGSSHMIITRVF